MKDFFIAAYKKERLLPNRLQAIIGLYIKVDANTADTTIHEFVESIMKRKNIDERTIGDLQSIVNWLKDLKELYPSEGFCFAYETLSSMNILREKKRKKHFVIYCFLHIALILVNILTANLILDWDLLGFASICYIVAVFIILFCYHKEKPLKKKLQILFYCLNPLTLTAVTMLTGNSRTGFVRACGNSLCFFNLRFLVLLC